MQVLLFSLASSLASRPPPRYVIDLDSDPVLRWQPIVVHYPEFIDLVTAFYRDLVPPALLPLVEKIAADIDQYIEAPYSGEMIGIAKAFNVSLGKIVMANLVYDVSAHGNGEKTFGFCTSIVSQDSQNRIWHSRNLDYSFTDLLENITIAVDFQQNGTTVYSMITYAGYIGALSGQRPQVFTVTVDERDQGSILYNLIVAILDRKAKPVSFLVRDAIAYDDTFEAAVDRLANTSTAAPVYFILGGVNPGEGVVITKGRLAADDIWRLEPASGRWYLVETNYDHWTTPPPTDNRRDPAIKAMNKMGWTNISKSALYTVMTTHPVLNSHTTYTVIMSAGQPDIMQTWVWGQD